MMRCIFTGIALSAAIVSSAGAQQLSFWFEGTPFTITDLGIAAGVTDVYGGLCFKHDDPDTLLLCGDSDAPTAQIFAVQVVRGPDGHITGFDGVATFFASAPGLGGGGLDGSLMYGPDNVLFYTTWNDNTIGQIEPGSTGPDRLIDLTALGIAPSTGALCFVPPGFPSAGHLKILSWTTGDWHDSIVQPDGAGTFDILNVTPPLVVMGGQAEAVLYVPAAEPSFEYAYGKASPHGYVLVSKFIGGRIDAYYVDEQGDPIIADEMPFIDNVDCAQGMAWDPVTGDLLISSYGCPDRVVLVSGFAAVKARCTEDLDGDGVVNGIDLATLLGGWGGSGAGDLDGSGTINGLDLALLLGAWGPCG